MDEDRIQALDMALRELERFLYVKSDSVRYWKDGELYELTFAFETARETLHAYRDYRATRRRTN